MGAETLRYWRVDSRGSAPLNLSALQPLQRGPVLCGPKSQSSAKLNYTQATGPFSVCLQFSATKTLWLGYEVKLSL